MSQLPAPQQDNKPTGRVASPVVGVIRADKMQKMFEERLGKRAGQFTTSLISLVNSNEKLQQCEPMTVIQAALTAAAMDLPINQNLGFAYVIPYNNNKKFTDESGKPYWEKVWEAQFQMGYKGFIQLAQRSGTFKTINVTDVREGELKYRDRMTGVTEFTWIEDDTERNAKPIVGYLAYFELLSGFSKSLFMTKAQVEAHASRFSQAYSKGYESPWKSDFDAMAQKTVLKQLLNKFAPLSTEMQEAVLVDQSVDDGKQRRFIDNDELANVNATADKKSAILAANGVQDDEIAAPTLGEKKPPADPKTTKPAAK
jgi:recombination protein RecT